MVESNNINEEIRNGTRSLSGKEGQTKGISSGSAYLFRRFSDCQGKICNHEWKQVQKFSPLSRFDAPSGSALFGYALSSNTKTADAVTSILLGILHQRKSKHLFWRHSKSISHRPVRPSLQVQSGGRYYARKNSQDALIDGTFEWDEDVPMDFRELLSTFGSHAKPPKQIVPNLSYDAFKKFIKASKEKTSTSPSSRHYGHYKALLDEAPDVLHDIFCLMDLSIRNGIFLQRYKKTLTTLICKESGNPYLHRFRLIHIIEAELQFISKYLWAKKMINSAEDNNIITDAQYGGRHGRQAQSSVLNTVLYYDLHRQLRKDFTSNDDDMKANFDREIPHYSAAETRSLGMSHEVGQFLVNATSSQEYFIRTPNGPSASSYTFNEDRPIWGLGQGVGWAGACWQLTASTISKCMNKSCLGIRLGCPEGKLTVQKLMDFYIDDTKKVCNQAGEGMTLLDQTQFNMQKHANYIATTGGALALDKCTWYHIQFSFNGDGDPQILKKHEMPGEIEVNTNFNGPKVKIKRLEYDQPHRTLGYFVSPDGQTDMHYNFTLDLVRKWKTRVTSSRLNSSQILQSYETVLKRQILYRSVATSFSYEQCDTMMKLINPVLLHSANVQEHFPRSIMEAGGTYAGFDWTHLYDLHGQEKLQFFLMHLRKKDTTGDLLNMSLKYTQLQLGIAKPFLSVDYDTYSPFCQSTWITHLWEYASSRGLEVSLAEPITVKSENTKDPFIMDILLRSSILTPDDCKIANKVRLSLQVLHMSDIVDGRGRRLLPDVRNGTLYRTSNLEWPKQVLLNKWLPVWQKACGVLQRYVSSNAIKLNNEKLLQSWCWETNVSREFLTDGTTVYKKITTRKGQYYVQSLNPLPHSAECNLRVDLTFTKNRPKIIHVYPGEGDESQTHTNESSNPQPQQDHDFWKRIYGAWDNLLPTVEDELIQAIKEGQLLIGLDGSVTNGIGAYSFGFFHPNSNPIYLHHGPVHGDEDQQNSTQSEMHGILGAVLFLRYLSAKYKLCGTYDTLTVLGDNIESLRVSRNGPSPSLKNVFSSDVDVSSELYYQIRTSPFQFEFEHVKAHLDDEEDYDLLTVEAKINVQCDRFVTRYYVDPPLPNCALHLQKIPRYPNEAVSISNLFSKITNSYKSNIHKYKVGHDAEKQCAKTWNIEPSALKEVDWMNMKKEFHSRKRSTRFQLTKAIHKQWPVMLREKRWKRAVCALCPLCKKTIETALHVFQCNHPVVKVNRLKCLTSLKTSLIKFETCPQLTNHIYRIIQQICGDYEVTKINIPNESSSTEQLRRIALAIEVQIDRIGATNMVFGIVTPLFSSSQDLYYKNNSFGRNYTAARWGRWLIRVLYDFTLSLWKFRCNVMHEKNEGTLEYRLRGLASAWLTQLQSNPTLIPIESRHLLTRSVKYFTKGDIRSINAYGYVELLLSCKKYK